MKPSTFRFIFVSTAVILIAIRIFVVIFHLNTHSLWAESFKDMAHLYVGILIGAWGALHWKRFKDNDTAMLISLVAMLCTVELAAVLVTFVL